MQPIQIGKHKRSSGGRTFNKGQGSPDQPEDRSSSHEKPNPKGSETPSHEGKHIRKQSNLP